MSKDILTSITFEKYHDSVYKYIHTKLLPESAMRILNEDYVSDKECSCEEKVILAEGDGLNIGRESWCSVHGYFSSCFMCSSGNTSTELCTKHHAWYQGLNK